MTSKLKFIATKDTSWENDKPDIDVHDSTQFIYNAHHSLALDLQRRRLPIFKKRANVIYIVEKYQVVVLIGETGCGKSTQVPQYLLEAEWGADGRMIGITEPRRVAATSLANRVADERGCLLGTEVGYCIRFDDRTDESTKIKYMTEGILLREIMKDPLLTRYCVIMLDEVHERTVLTDIIMGLLKKIIRKRKDLKLVVSSATVDARQIRDFFNRNTAKIAGRNIAAIMEVEGRTHPVEIYYVEEPVPNYVQAVVDTALKIHDLEGPGDIIAFLTGMDEVDHAVSLLKEHARLIKDGKQKILPLPMYGSLPTSEQLKVFKSVSRDTRKIIVATNIAEASITISNVTYAIDCGFIKVPWFDSVTRTNTLLIVPVSKASAVQRAGRAGRIKTGKAYRLYTEESFNGLVEAIPPQMQRSDLASAILILKGLGIDDVLRFEFPSSPSSRNLASALEVLFALGAIDTDGYLTSPIGMIMAELPLEPALSKCLIMSGQMGCSDEISTIISMLQVQNILLYPDGGEKALKAQNARRKFEVEQGDLIKLLNIYLAYERYKTSQWCRKYYLDVQALRRATAIRARMRILMEKLNIPITSCDASITKILKCITAGLFTNAAFLDASGVYKTIRGQRELHVHEDSCLSTEEKPSYIIFYEILQTDRAYIRELTKIQSEWLLELAPHFYQKIKLPTI